MSFDIPITLKTGGGAQTQKHSTIDEDATIISSKENTLPPRTDTQEGESLSNRLVGATQSILIHEEQYYALKPQRNPLFCLLEDLRNYKVTLQTLGSQIEARGIRNMIPEQMGKLRIIIEYSDSIIQAKDITQYQELLDEANPNKNIAFKTFQNNQA